MTRLLELLVPVAFIGMIWLSLVTGIIPVTLSSSWWQVIIPFPLYCLITFGCYALASVGYSVYQVKSDDIAAEQLLQDIEDAKADLIRKGYRFDT